MTSTDIITFRDVSIAFTKSDPWDYLDQCNSFKSWADMEEAAEYIKYLMETIVDGVITPDIMTQEEYISYLDDIRTNNFFAAQEKKAMFEARKKRAIKDYERDASIWVDGEVGGTKLPRSQRMCAHGLRCQRLKFGKCDFMHPEAPVVSSEKMPRCKFGSKCQRRETCKFSH